jgi:hypothetical protein
MIHTLVDLVVGFFKRTFPLTLLGTVCLSLSLYLSLVYAHDHKDQILSTLIILAIFQGILSLLIYVEMYRVRRLLKTYAALPPLEAEVDQDVLTGFRMPNWQWIPFFQLKIQWISPPIREYDLVLDQGALAELVCFSRRGQLDCIERTLILEDVFGLTSVSWNWMQKSTFSILPKSVRLDPQSVRQVQEGEDESDSTGTPQGDYLELRRYQPGDPLKLVMWRVYARSRQLMVRAPERALSLKDDLVAYFITDPSDESSASTARAYLEQKLLGEDFTFFADGTLGGATNSATAQLALLHSIQGNAGQALPQLLALDPKRLRGGLVFASAALDPQILSQILNQFPSPPRLLLSYPHDTAPLDPPSHFEKLFLHPQVQNSSSISLHQITQTYSHFQHLGFKTTLIVQPEGRVVSDLEIERLMQ